MIELLEHKQNEKGIYLMPTITQSVVDEFNRIAYWDSIKMAWCYREDRYGGASSYIMKRKGDAIGSPTSGKGYYRIIIHKKCFRLHRVAYCVYHNTIIDDKAVLDHANGVRTDNSKENLRLGTVKENSCNKSKLGGCTSPYKGVYWQKNRKKWYAQIVIDNENLFLGGFDAADDAARAYNDAAKMHFGEYARLNVIPSESGV